MLLRRSAPCARMCFMIPAILLVVFGASFIFSCTTDRGIRRSIARTDRDPVTEVIRGLEAVTLQPEAAPTSATRNTACLLVHGFIGSRRDFNELGQHLAQKGFTVRMMRLPGHGTSPADFAYLPDGELLKAVQQEYRDLKSKYERVNVIGFSMGGALSTLLASEEPVNRLVLLAPYYGVTYYWYYLLPAETWNAVASPFVSYVPKTERFVRVNDRSVVSQIFTYDYMPTRGARQLMVLGREARKDEVLKKITCPVLIMHSTGDVAANPAASREAFGKLGSTQKKYVTLTRSNHHILWDYERDEVTREVEAFLLGADAGKPTPAVANR